MLYISLRNIHFYNKALSKKIWAFSAVFVELGDDVKAHIIVKFIYIYIYLPVYAYVEYFYSLNNKFTPYIKRFFKKLCKRIFMQSTESPT